jgi:hypothetical protein
VDLHLEVDLEDEALAALADDRLEAGVEVVRLALGRRPVEREDEGRHDLGCVHAGVDGVLAGAQRLLPDAAVSRPDDRAELELGARGVERRQPDEALDHRHLALVDDQHRDELDPHQERVEQVGAVQQRVVLQADAAPVVEERLEVLVVVVQVVLGPQQRLDELGVGGVGLGLEVGDVVEAAQPGGDVAPVERLALERGDQADHVLVALGSDDHDLELLGRQPERHRREAPVAGDGRQLGRHRDAEHLARRDHDERHRVDRHQRARGQHRALDALLAAVEERLQVREVAERGAVDGALGADGQGVPDLGDHDADLARRHLHPWVALDREERPQAEPQARHEQLGLVAGLVPEGDGVVTVQLAEAELLVDEADLRRPDAVHGLHAHQHHQQCRRCRGGKYDSHPSLFPTPDVGVCPSSVSA